MFLKKKLLKKWFYGVEDAVSPETIIWENLGVSLWTKVKKWAQALALIILAAAVSLYGFWQMAALEKARRDYTLRDCRFNDAEIDVLTAFADWN